MRHDQAMFSMTGYPGRMKYTTPVVCKGCDKGTSAGYVTL
jgi:hypothetical protein